MKEAFKRVDYKNQRENLPKQRVANAEEAEALIPQGWRFVGVLPNGKVVLEYSDPKR